MKRRRWLGFAAAAVIWPWAAVAQRAAMPFIGFLNTGGPNERRHLVDAFRQGLKEAGYVDGRDVAIEYRWAEGRYDRLPALAKELAERQVSLFLTSGGPASALAAKAATRSIPIVFLTSRDPVELGLVKSLSRPGGNATGVYNSSVTLESKRFELLRDLLPRATRIAFLANPASPNAKVAEQQMKVVAAAAHKQVEILTASTEEQLAAAFEAAKKSGVDALLVGSDAFFIMQRERIVGLAARHRIPAVYPFREFPRAGGLISYGANLRDQYRQAGIYAARVLKGAKPADLPVLQAQQFETILNVGVAKKLGLELSRDFMARVDELIE